MATTRPTAPGPLGVTSLDETSRAAVARLLQPTLVELIDLALTGKQLHWTVTGPHFRALHHQLDELVDAYREWADEVAERMTALGVPPDGRVERVAGDSPADPAPDGWVRDEAVVDLLLERLRAVVAQVRQRMQEVGELDLASQDTLIGIVKGLEEQLWMLSAQR